MAIALPSYFKRAGVPSLKFFDSGQTKAVPRQMEASVFTEVKVLCEFW